MNKLLWGCASLLTLFVGVEALMCNTCDVSILGSCLFSKPVNCTVPKAQCYKAVATFSADMLDIHDAGCIAEGACKNVTNAAILNVKYNITMRCCNTNLCNGAASVQLPLTAALGAAVVALWSQWAL